MNNPLKRVCATIFLVLALWQLYMALMKFSAGDSYALRLATGFMCMLAALLILRSKQKR